MLFECYILGSSSLTNPTSVAVQDVETGCCRPKECGPIRQMAAKPALTIGYDEDGATCGSSHWHPTQRTGRRKWLLINALLCVYVLAVLLLSLSLA